MVRQPSSDKAATKRTVGAMRASVEIKSEIQRDLAAYDAYVEKHGSPAEMLRDYLADRDDTA